MSKLFQSKKKEVSKTEIDPQVYNYVLQNLQFAQDVANRPYQPYTGMMVAPFTRDYMRGEQMTRRIASEGGYVPELEAAARQAYADLGYQAGPISTRGVDTSVTPGRVGTTFAARDISAPGAAPTVEGASFLGRNISEYMNPYTSQVIETGLEDIDRAERQRQAELGRRATAARAFGGSRQAVEAGIAAGEAARERNRYLAEQRQQAFREAAALRESDVGREQQARLANQDAAQRVMELAQRGEISNQQRDIELQRLGTSAEQFNVEAGLRGRQMQMTAEEAQAQRELEAMRANEAARLGAGQFRLGVGQQLAGFGQSALQNRYGAAGAMMGLGTAQQDLYQRYLDAQREEFMRQQNYPLQQLAIRQGAVSASPYNVTQTGTVTSRPSYWQMAGQVAGTLAGFSDENMKEGIEKIKNPLDKVNRLKGIEFEWADEYKDDVEENGQEPEGKSMSVSAQDVKKVMPEAIENGDNGMMMVKLPQLVGLLTEAVKELDAKVESSKRKGKK